MNRLKTLPLLTCALAWLAASTAVADTATITAFVEKTQVNSGAFRGGCLVSLSEDPADSLPACRPEWVTFSCDGTYTDPVRAYRMLDQAQLALATGMQVQVFVTDAKMQDGVCVATRIKVMNE